MLNKMRYFYIGIKLFLILALIFIFAPLAFCQGQPQAPKENKPSLKEAGEQSANELAMAKELTKANMFNLEFEEKTRLLEKEIASIKDSLAKAKTYNLQLEEKVKELYLRRQDYDRFKSEAENLGVALEKSNKERIALKDNNSLLIEEKAALVSQISVLKDETRTKEAYLYREFGAACVKAKMQGIAFDAYLKSISLNPDDAQANYELGLLYKDERGDNQKAVEHLKKYLKLNPKAENRKEVEYLIKMISESLNFVDIEGGGYY